MTTRTIATRLWIQLSRNKIVRSYTTRMLATKKHRRSGNSWRKSASLRRRNPATKVEKPPNSGLGAKARAKVQRLDQRGQRIQRLAFTHLLGGPLIAVPSPRGMRMPSLEFSFTGEFIPFPASAVNGSGTTGKRWNSRSMCHSWTRLILLDSATPSLVRNSKRNYLMLTTGQAWLPGQERGE